MSVSQQHELNRKQDNQFIPGDLNMIVNATSTISRVATSITFGVFKTVNALLHQLMGGIVLLQVYYLRVRLDKIFSEGS